MCGTEKGRHKSKNHRTAGEVNNLIIEITEN